MICLILWFSWVTKAMKNFTKKVKFYTFYTTNATESITSLEAIQTQYHGYSKLYLRIYSYYSHLIAISM